MSTTAAQSVDNLENDQNSKPNDKEYNFRALETKFTKILESERAEKERLAREIEELKSLTNARRQEEEDETEPYVDHRKLEKKLAKFGEINEKKTQTNIQQAIKEAIYEERKQAWLDNHGDFVDVLQNADKFAQKHPSIAQSILQMPDSFERQKLVYETIKSLGLDRPEQKQPSIQEKIDANRRSPYYQPTGVATAPYASVGDFSATGQKQAFDKMKELQSKLRL